MSTNPSHSEAAMRAVEEAITPPRRPAAPPPSPFTNGTPPLTPTGEAFASLRKVLDEAFQQSAAGKGAERHGRGVPFDRQPILEIQRMVGPGFAMGQAMKKAQEAAGMVSRGDREAACRELLGTIVYAAAAIVAIREL